MISISIPTNFPRRFRLYWVSRLDIICVSCEVKNFKDQFLESLNYTMQGLNINWVWPNLKKLQWYGFILKRNYNNTNSCSSIHKNLATKNKVIRNKNVAGITLIVTTKAIAITNMIVVVGESFYPSALTELQTHGFWGIAPEVHTDWAMWLGSLFLLLKGGGLLTVFYIKENIHSPGVITLNITFTTFALLLMLAMNSLT